MNEERLLFVAIAKGFEETNAKITMLESALLKLTGTTGRSSKGLSLLGHTASTALGVFSAHAVMSGMRRTKELLGSISSSVVESVGDYERLSMVIRAANAREAVTAARAEGRTLSLGDAYKSIGQTSTRYLNVVRDLALTRPVTEKEIADTFRILSGYQLGVPLAMRYTAALADFGIATGRTSEEIARLSLAIGQVQAKGKLMGEEMRQLTNAGITIDYIVQGLNKRFPNLGVTVDNFYQKMRAGELKASLVMPALLDTLEEFSGLGKEVAKNWAGIPIMLSNISRVVQRTALGPALQELAKPIGEFIGLFDLEAHPETLRGLEDIGQSLATAIRPVTDFITNNTIPAIQRLFIGLSSGETVIDRIGNALLNMFYGFTVKEDPWRFLWAAFKVSVDENAPLALSYLKEKIMTDEVGRWLGQKVGEGVLLPIKLAISVPGVAAKGVPQEPGAASFLVSMSKGFAEAIDAMLGPIFGYEPRTFEQAQQETNDALVNMTLLITLLRKKVNLYYVLADALSEQNIAIQHVAKMISSVVLMPLLGPISGSMPTDTVIAWSEGIKFMWDLISAIADEIEKVQAKIAAAVSGKSPVELVTGFMNNIAAEMESLANNEEFRTKMEAAGQKIGEIMAPAIDLGMKVAMAPFSIGEWIISKISGDIEKALTSEDALGGAESSGWNIINAVHQGVWAAYNVYLIGKEIVDLITGDIEEASANEDALSGAEFSGWNIINAVHRGVVAAYNIYLIGEKIVGFITGDIEEEAGAVSMNDAMIALGNSILRSVGAMKDLLFATAQAIWDSLMAELQKLVPTEGILAKILGTEAKDGTKELKDFTITLDEVRIYADSAAQSIDKLGNELGNIKIPEQLERKSPPPFVVTLSEIDYYLGMMPEKISAVTKYLGAFAGVATNAAVIIEKLALDMDFISKVASTADVSMDEMVSNINMPRMGVAGGRKGLGLGDVNVPENAFGPLQDSAENARNSVRDMGNEIDRVKSLIGSLLTPSSGDIRGNLVGTSAQFGDAWDEIARRWADVAQQGKASPWADFFKVQIPADVWDEGGEALKAFARMMQSKFYEQPLASGADVGALVQDLVDKLKSQADQKGLQDVIWEQFMLRPDAAQLLHDAGYNAATTVVQGSLEAIKPVDLPSLLFGAGSEMEPDTQGAEQGQPTGQVAQIATQLQTISNIVSNNVNPGFTEMGRITNETVNALNRVKESVEQLGSSIRDKVISNLNSAKRIWDSIHSKTIVITVITRHRSEGDGGGGGGGTRMQRGTITRVPGAGSRDSVPYNLLLAPGELLVVIPRRTVSAARQMTNAGDVMPGGRTVIFQNHIYNNMDVARLEHMARKWAFSEI
mgnify:CR=1 FL=1